MPESQDRQRINLNSENRTREDMATDHFNQRIKAIAAIKVSTGEK